MFSFFSPKPPHIQEKSSQFSTLMYQSMGTPLWTEDGFENQVTQGYARNPIVHRCITLLARSIACVPFSFVQQDKKLTQHPVVQLLQNPNPLHSQNSFLEALVTHLFLSGNAYVEAVSPAHGPPQELYTLRPDRLRVIPGKKGLPLGYEYHLGTLRQRVDVDPLTGHCSLLHMKLFNPLDDWYGMSPLTPAQSSIDLHNIVIGHNVALLQNEGRPSGALIIRNGKNLTEAQRAQLRGDLQRLYAGKENAGRMMVLEGDFEWKEMGFSPKDLDFTEGRDYVSREITQVFGIPPLCIGLRGDATFSNYQEARAHFWEETVVPFWHFIFGRITPWLCTLFQESFHFVCEKDRIEALANQREKLWDRLNTCSFLTLEEKRQAMGYAPHTL